MPAPLLIDLSHTCHTRARTGIQRVTRAVLAAFGDRARPITHDPYRRAWRELQPWERHTLTTDALSAKRGARWPLAARVRGTARRLLGGEPPLLPENSGLLVPEVFSPAVARSFHTLFPQVRGPRIAVFHDAIALKLPELTPHRTVARFPPYLVELLGFDGVAAVSEDSRSALVDYWRWLGVAGTPPVRTVPLGVTRRPPAPAPAPPPADPPLVLCVGTLEGRKNHLALLEACAQLWTRGARFSLHLIGLAHADTGAAATALIRSLQAAGRPLRYDGAATDEAVEAAYAVCSFTVYPSLAEGFGLPVIESLAHGKPCICSAHGALGESSRGGGCLALPAMDTASLATALAHLIESAPARENLAAAARARRFRDWPAYAAELSAWMAELQPRR